MSGAGRTVAGGAAWAAVLIAGPTASGKSALALALAREFDGVVVNADSMQVYRDLRVLTARPSVADEAAAPHRLYGTVDAADAFSVARYATAATAALAEIEAEGRRAIVVGGTGLYFKALTDGLSDVPAVPAEVRERVRAAAEGRATPDLHAELAAADPEGAARLSPGDRQRILRALEVLAATGRPLAAFQGRRRPGPLDGRRLLRFFLAPEREVLRARIDARFAAMIASGALDEVAHLAARGLDPGLPAMRAHGVPALLAHRRGEITLGEAVARGQADTRAYAKRQATWFRHQAGPGWTWIAPEAALGAARDVLAEGSG